MVSSNFTKMLYIAVFEGDKRAQDIAALVPEAQSQGWPVRVISTRKVFELFDDSAIETQTGLPVRYAHRITPQSRIPTSTDCRKIRLCLCLPCL
ncbi:hypothetical protein EW146_g2378 [Bondarzewia mesenterica]|uniref:Uncharacterized protein n=1 Tax=Bondarzewia mesenterica TaxID=1095465 RepID=A0A4V6S1J0_9AGAM|nr:hypothetical protein EW146_g2378 [Bondarzewia mesenterica]